MRKWISIILVAALVLTGGYTWRHWLPRAVDFTLRQNRAITLRQVGITLLKFTDPVLRNVGRYLTPEFTEAIDEHFLYFAKTQDAAPEDTEEDAIKAANLSALSGSYKQVNGTAVANATNYDVSDLLSKTVPGPEFKKGKPAILIYHTHTTECYRNAKGITNTTDESKNVVAVGAAMAKVFEAAGYKTIHVKTVFNRPNFSGAYATARKEIEPILEKNPTIRVVLDLHRDSISSNGVDYYPVTRVKGKEAAQVMIVCGTDEKGLEHPHWRKNFTYALQLSRKMGELYGELSRPVNLRGDRFNTHFTKHTLLLEMGSAVNTLEQALYAAELTANSMIELWEN